MFKTQPNVFAHISAMKNGNFVLHDKIIVKNGNLYDIKNRECPHRGYLMHEPGDQVNNVVCKLHGFAWDQKGRPLEKESQCSHFYKMHHQGTALVGKTGLLFEDFDEPEDAEWVKILSDAPPMVYERSIIESSSGSWLWLMEQMTDLLHVRQNGIHPRQSLETPLDEMETDFGDGWAIQIYPTCYGSKGFWLFVYPGFNIEYEPGRLLITRVTPNDINNEFGFTWHMQLYYSPNIGKVEKEEWEKCVEVYKEDVKAIENIKRPFFPLKRTVNKWEDQMKHWGEWYTANKIK
jgi:phenylpropionate dioxygenase-like ring-hydroxylating dioxygenase large terminal subunit